MFETIIVVKTIPINIIRRVDVNQFDLSSELLFEGMESDEVVAFDDKVFANRAVFVPLDIRYVLFTCGGVAFPISEDFRIEHPIDFVLCKDFVEEDLFALFLFLCLSSL